MMTEEFIMNRETAWQILTEDLEMTKISATMMPWILTENQKEHSLQISSILFKKAVVFDTAITIDWTLCYQYDPIYPIWFAITVTVCSFILKQFSLIYFKWFIACMKGNKCSYADNMCTLIIGLCVSCLLYTSRCV